MTYFRYEAKSLLGRQVDARTSLFRLSLLAVMGQRALQGQPPFLRDTLSRATRGSISFYANEVLVPKSPRFTLAIVDQDTYLSEPARAILEIEYTALIHRRAPVEIDVIYPERLLGLGHAFGFDDGSRYTDVFFNLTPGELSGNLFDALGPICSAYAATEAAYEVEGAQARLDGDQPGRFPATYQALHERVL